MGFLTPDAPKVEPQEIVPPVAPIEDASVQFAGEDDSLNKKKTGKSSLKLPLADTSTTGLKV